MPVRNLERYEDGFEWTHNGRRYRTEASGHNIQRYYEDRGTWETYDFHFSLRNLSKRQARRKLNKAFK
jgi:hypothetical protein